MNHPKHIPLWLMANASRPNCFDRDQWLAWRKAALDVGLKKQIPSSYCEDCLPEHQAAMTQAGRCEHPEVTFEEDRDGFVRGVRPLATREKSCQELGVCQSKASCGDECRTMPTQTQTP